MTSGLSSSKAGLTVSVTRDEIDGRWVADAGAMCLADGGMFFMDELGDLPKPDQAILHEAMEEQRASYAKAGLVGSYNTRCSTISCMNPKRGRFDQYADLADQVDVKPALLSRFDLLYLMLDIPAKEYDAGVAGAILDDDGEEGKVRDDIIPIDTLRKYIAFSKKLKNPSFSQESKKILSDYYLKVRGDMKAGSPIPITARAMDTLKRLSVSHAKIRLSDTVTVRDAELAVQVLDESLKNVATDPTTGKQDIDRVSGGQSKHKRDLAANVMDSIRTIHAKQGACRKPDIESRLMELKITFGDSELERLLDSLKQSGDLTESKGIYKVM
jgi:replicative DNA helicase Mcm